MTRRVVFLDIDGVLNRDGEPTPDGPRKPGCIYDAGDRIYRVEPRPGAGLWDAGGDSRLLWAILHKDLVARMRDFVAEVEAGVVIASTWAWHLDLEAIEAMLAAAGWPEAPLLGVPPRKLSSTKPIERDWWVRDNLGEGDRYMVIDDSPKALQAPTGDLDFGVLIDPREGFTERDASRATRLLLAADPLAERQGQTLETGEMPEV